MAKRHSPSALASLFDAASHLEPILPQELMLAWTASDQEERTAQAFMADYATEGTCVLGDASGLSKLSRELPLTDVLAMLHMPKSMVMAAGLATGGQAINGWTADNTAMWFPKEVSEKQVLDCTGGLVASFHNLPFQMSFGLHRGIFYKVGATLLGTAYQTLEHIAENEVPAGKIWASQEFCRGLPEHQATPHQVHGITMMELLQAYEPSYCFADSRVSYPHSFDATFFTLLDMYARADVQEKEILRESLEQHASREGFILFFAYELQKSLGLAGVISQQVEDTMLRSRFASLPGCAGAQWIKAGGGIGILEGNSLEALFTCAKQIAQTCAEEGVDVAFGIDKGSYFIFEQEDGDRDVAGSPVNIASKLSEDSGVAGSILISKAAWQGGRIAEPRLVEVSGLRFTAMELVLAQL